MERLILTTLTEVSLLLQLSEDDIRTRTPEAVGSSGKAAIRKLRVTN